jgi:peroxiredoxin
MSRLLLSLAVVACLVGCNAGRPPATSVVGRAAPPASAALLDGTTLDLGRGGDVVAIAFFTTWCPASAEMLRALDDVRERTKGQGLVIVALGEDESAQKVGDFVNAKQLKLAVGLDTGGRLARQLQLPTVPSIVLIDRKGVVRHLHAGYHGAADRATLGADLAALLLEGAPGNAPGKESAPGKDVESPEVVATDVATDVAAVDEAPAAD